MLRARALHCAAVVAPGGPGCHGRPDRTDRPARPAGDRSDVTTRAVALARSAATLRRALAAVAARVVERRAWERLGYARADDYARERAGISGRQLLELAHVDGVFARVPRLAEAFLAGEVGWSQARLLARVVTGENVEAWLAVAASLSAGALAREVRAVDARARAPAAPGIAAPDEDGPRETVRLEISARGRALWSRARLLASRLHGRRVTPAVVAEAVAAEVLSALLGEGDASARDAPEEAPVEVAGADAADPEEVGVAPWRGPAPESLAEMPLRPAQGAAPPGGSLARLPLLAELTDGLAEADAFALDARLRRALRLEQRRLVRLAPLLAEVAEGRLYRPLGFASLGAFAREWLGMSVRKAQALLRLERACAVCPALRAAWRSARLSWVQAHALVPVVVREEAVAYGAAWVAQAEAVSVRQLEEDVERALASGALDPDAQTCARPTELERRLTMSFAIQGVPCEVARLVRGALAVVQRRIEARLGRTSSEAEAFEAMLEHALESWEALRGRVPRAHRVFERDGWRCAVPGCSSWRNLHAHHVRFRSAGGSDALSNLVTLCAWHHLRGVHAGVLRIAGRAPERLRFELGLRRGAPALVVYASGDRKLARI